jgi:hypothetical protein
MGNSLPNWSCGFKKGVFPNEKSHMLVSLIKEYNLKNIAEIGVFKGTLTNRVFQNCKGIIENYYCIDPWKPYIENYDREARSEESTVEYWNNIFNMVSYMCIKNPEIHMIRDTSLNAINQIEDRTLDAVYIDAIHDYDNGKSDILAWLDKVKDGGIVSGHDYLKRFCGLIKAIDEIFGMDLTVYGDSNWFVKIEKDKRIVYKK